MTIKQPSLTITRPTFYDIGEYSCNAKDIKGTVTGSAIQLNVIGEPRTDAFDQPWCYYADGYKTAVWHHCMVSVITNPMSTCRNNTDVTTDDVPLPEAFRRLEEQGAAIVGLHCGRGPRTVLLLIKDIKKVSKCVFPIDLEKNVRNLSLYEPGCDHVTGHCNTGDCFEECSSQDLDKTVKEFVIVNMECNSITGVCYKPGLCISNRFGEKCGDFVIVKKEPGCDHVTGHCNTGDCSEECSSQRFGDCERVCHCQHGECNNITGICYKNLAVKVGLVIVVITNGSDTTDNIGFDETSELYYNNFTLEHNDILHGVKLETNMPTNFYGNNCQSKCHCAVDGCNTITGVCNNPTAGYKVPWTGRKCATPVPCPDINMTESIELPTKLTKYHLQDIAIFKCKSGYILSGNDTNLFGLQLTPKEHSNIDLKRAQFIKETSFESTVSEEAAVKGVNNDNTYYNKVEVDEHYSNEEDGEGYYSFTLDKQIPRSAVLMKEFYDYVENGREVGGKLEMEFAVSTLLNSIKFQM
ncbi:unnamed protein product [Mytilus edulis]|uniref:Uncharacterized protein n=1 Tax=Mytilus edulis TaxID=6550 RepID=A0A8S3Q2F4_MYTED|nr:unnamed protein product [Mytilus edulis]